nr:iron-sulfur cluster carrier protein ApbC [Tatumella saanichensis]
MADPRAAAPDIIYHQVSEVLKRFTHPTLQQDVVQLKSLHHVALLDSTLHIELQMPFAWQSGFETLQDWATPLLLSLDGIDAVDWRLSHDIATLKRVKDHAATPGVKNIIAVSSGKGGVGKSSTAINLALALKAEGASVGLLDADIYGPSLPLMLGSEGERPSSPDGKHMTPIAAHGLASNSIGYLVTDDNAMVWRGPMASKALMQLLNETLWPELDYLIIDMPPGTGDIQLTLAQNIPVTAALVVTTPQDVALLDARKGILMFNKVSVPVIGMIENMSQHICSQCGHHEAIFGTGGAEALSEEYGIPLAGQIPLHITLREDLDAGQPTVVRRPDSEFTRLYRNMAATIAARLYWQGEVILPDISLRTL